MIIFDFLQRAAMLCFDKAMDIMSIQNGGQGGTIINICSIYGLAPFSVAPCYAGTEHFWIGFTRSYGLAYHFGKTGVKVMALCPGLTLNPGRKCPPLPYCLLSPRELKQYPSQR